MTGRRARPGTVADGPTADAGSLAQARDSLADAVLLSERGRRNAALLLDLALRQALSAIGPPTGPDALVEPALDGLLRRIPSDHPASALAEQLADPRARDADAVGRLINALSTPSAAEESKRVAETGTAKTGGAKRKKAARSLPATVGTEATTERAGSDGHRMAAAARGDAPSAGASRTEPAGHPGGATPDPGIKRLDDGPTAFEAAAHGGQEPRRTRPDAPHAVSSTAFWALADRWRLGDEEALALLGSGRTLTARGTRPRFRLQNREAGRHRQLQRIDTGLEAQGEQPDWLRRARREAPFAGRTPLALLLDGEQATERVLHALNRTGLRAALYRASQGRDNPER